MDVLFNMGMTGEEEAEVPGATEHLCRWIHHLQIEDIPEHVRTRAKHLILDGLACAIVGAHVPWSERAASSMQAFEPNGNATIFGHQYVRLPFFTGTANVIPPCSFYGLARETSVGSGFHYFHSCSPFLNSSPRNSGPLPPPSSMAPSFKPANWTTTTMKPLFTRNPSSSRLLSRLQTLKAMPSLQPL